MKIGIELNGIVRNLNKQIVKYYVQDINKSFDDDEVDLNVVDVTKALPFESKKALKKFIFEDYPYEIFGCAQSMVSGLGGLINTWILELEDNGHEVIFFSMKENGLAIQSTYFFLAKIGSRVREMLFPKTESEIWNKCDVIITNNKSIVDKTPIDKVCVRIRTNDKVQGIGDTSFGSMEEILNDVNFIKEIEDIKRRKEEIRAPWKVMINTLKRLHLIKKIKRFK